ncbi:MAG: translation initiation factor IF-2 [Candidatus Niyogibacteria bacterium]|nr:translation initiation factor IF-2 [Candidatus Niyogibacteria bacterium]
MKKEVNKNQPQAEITRSPVVVVVGHIDHGKTKLLDHIRKTNVIEGESGGITQHIGAYEVAVSTKRGVSGEITFLDTPGHEAFSEIRSRGARVADVAILVVAADEGVKPQTEESIKAIQAADIPFVVAINKTDKEGANPERVKMQLAEKSVYVEGHGGKVPCVSVSAKEGVGVDDLLETVLLLAEMEELKAEAGVLASGVVIESSLEQKRGNAATLLIQNGTLRQGEFVAADSALAPVRIFEDFLGHSLKEARFSSPVRVVGFNVLPPVGSSFQAFSSKQEAEKALVLNAKPRPVPHSAEKFVSGETEKIVVPMVLRADVSGSLEALEKEVKKFGSDKIGIKILKSGTGMVGEDDLKAAASVKDLIIIAFRVGIDRNMIESLRKSGVLFKEFDIIYQVSDWLMPILESRLPQEVAKEEIGVAKVLKIFKKVGQKQVIGGRVTDGMAKSGAEFRVMRNEHQIGSGKVLELQHAKAKVGEVEKGQEFGLMASSEVSVAAGDMLEFFSASMVKGKL